MKFSEYTTLARQLSFKSECDFVDHLMKAKSDDKPTNVRAAIELLWSNERRPYYSVYPSIALALLKTKLDIPLRSLVWPLKNRSPILIRLDERSEGIKSVLCGIYEGQWYAICHCSIKKQECIYMGTISRHCETIEKDLHGLELGDFAFFAKDSFRLAIGICLLGSDSDFIKPDVLSSDQIAFSKSNDTGLIQKAIRRGKFGWLVGREVEFSPHVRRPHFAVRWTGKGGEVPRIVPVKGAIVKRKSITEVPTGFLDDEKQLVN
jgi:hypothetical protein